MRKSSGKRLPKAMSSALAVKKMSPGPIDNVMAQNKVAATRPNVQKRKNFAPPAGSVPPQPFAPPVGAPTPV